ncbi:uncharacterized protein LOC130693026 [Daphnia carinata]|uniref:uncharacterized protein LOC130693026 n=1 Tax=Daphnia carinata TaxID=120202 RepID=UPI00257E7C6B|nr:uncharacterized protein LOC130693026 [Daphnia carinata]
MKLAMLATMLAAALVLGVEQAAAAPADSSLATSRRLLHSSNPTSHTKSMDSWLRWLLFHARIGEKEKTKNAVPMANSFQLARTQVDLSNPKQQKLPISIQGNNSNDDDDATALGDEDFADEEVQLLLPEGRQAAMKRQPDDYGHMRYGKRDFDDYGHMRFGRR